MGRLAKRATILFEPSEYSLLQQIAEHERCSVGELIRRTMREAYMTASGEERRAAVDELAALSLPVDEWEVMEEEIIEGATE